MIRQEFTRVVLSFSSPLIRALPESSGAFGTELDKMASSTYPLAAAGYAIMAAFIVAQLGRPNAVEQRASLAAAGIACVVMGIFTSYGIWWISRRIKSLNVLLILTTIDSSALCGLFTTTMNLLMPFLVLGIGIDDMFVIVQTFETMDQEEEGAEDFVRLGDRCLEERMGICMKRAGVAVTITTVTDLVSEK